MPARSSERDEGNRAIPGRVVLGRESDDHVGVDRGTGDGRADLPHDAGVERGVVAASHPAQDAVVARLQRQVEMREAAPRPIDHPGVEQGVIHVLRLDRREPDPFDIGLRKDPPDQAGQRQRAAAMGPARARFRPAAVVRADVDPGQDDLAVTGRERAADVGEHGGGRHGSLGATRAWG